MTLAEIEQRTQAYAQARQILSDRVAELEDEIAAIKKQRMAGIKKAVVSAKEKQSLLSAAIAEAPKLFQKPRTVIIQGIKVGYQKGKGELQWDDTATVLTLIKRWLPELEPNLIKVTETPVKPALAQLSAHELKKLGITIVETGDQIVIKPADSEVDKLVNALLKEEPEEAA